MVSFLSVYSWAHSDHIVSPYYDTWISGECQEFLPGWGILFVYNPEERQGENRREKNAGSFRFRRFGSPLVASSPDVHLFRLGGQLVPEVRMADGNDPFRLFPGGDALEVHHAVFGDEIVDVCPGVGDDGTAGQGGTYPGGHGAVLGLDGGGTADEALSTLGEIGAQHEVQLAAGAGDMLGPGGFSVHLAEQIQVHCVIDGDEVKIFYNFISF